ncbi:MAG: hypothetical protein ACRDT0_02800 [Pseudonocardiaceae bacterium]
MTRSTVCGVILDVLAELALALVVPAYMTALAAVVLLADRRFALRGSRCCPRRGAGAR